MLSRQDVLAGEAELCADLATLFSFESHALYFPPGREVDGVAWVEEEKTLLLPLWLPVERENGLHDELLLGVLLLRGVTEDIQPFLPVLPVFVRQSLEKLVLKKQLERDVLTGLGTKETFLHRTARVIAGMRQAQATPAGVADAGENTDVAHSLAIVILCVQGLYGAGSLGVWARLFGHAFVRDVEAELGRAIGAIFADSSDIFPAFLGEGHFALLLPGAGQKEAEDAAYTLFGVCQQVQPKLGIAGQCGLGYALFPQDWDGRLPFATWRKIHAQSGHTRQGGQDSFPEKTRFLQPSLLASFLPEMHPNAHSASGPNERAEGQSGEWTSEWTSEWDDAREDALALFSFALLTARKCAERSLFSAGQSLHSPLVLAFSRLLSHGGTVTEVRDNGHDTSLRLNLGRDAGVRAGMVFCVKSAENLSVAEICVRHVEETMAHATLMGLYHPMRLPYVGERVVFSRLLGEEDAFLPRQEGLLSVAALRERLAQEKGPFVLALARLEEMPVSDMPVLQAAQGVVGASGLPNMLNIQGTPDIQGGPQNTFAPVQALWDTVLAMQPQTLGAVYNQDHLLLLHSAGPDTPGMEFAQKLQRMYAGLSDGGSAHFHLAGTGLFVFPYLDYTTADALDNAQKALEYALLLPAPHVGLFDTLAINISADKRFSQGDTLGAMAEYRRAILADTSNTLAWNSLGVCLARLGRYAEALEALEKAAQADLASQQGNMPPDASVHYNLGTTALSLGDKTKARDAFQNCIKLENTHIFAYLRLGQLEEEENDREKARNWYEAALAQAPFGPHYRVFRALARLEMAAENPVKAREYLHKALAENPQDAQSLALMAQLYLESGEDVSLAESLARQSVALMPSENPAWAILQKCLVLGSKLP